MFTGIIEEMGTILEVAKGAHSAVLTIAAQKVLEDVHIGDSIAVQAADHNHRKPAQKFFCV